MSVKNLVGWLNGMIDNITFAPPKKEAMTFIRKNIETILVLSTISIVCAVCLALGLHT